MIDLRPEELLRPAYLITLTPISVQIRKKICSEGMKSIKNKFLTFQTFVLPQFGEAIGHFEAQNDPFLIM